jgi:hypothetical protein
VNTPRIGSSDLEEGMNGLVSCSGTYRITNLDNKTGGAIV